MSFNQEIEHSWIPPEELPKTILGIFKDGACVIFTDEEYTGAIPATNKQTGMLADLFESAAVALDDDFTGALKQYNVLRDELCGARGHQVCALLFKQELDKMKEHEEAVSKDKRCLLASAARPRGN
jgi:hypothetical protein